MAILLEDSQIINNVCGLRRSNLCPYLGREDGPLPRRVCNAPAADGCVRGALMTQLGLALPREPRVIDLHPKTST